MATADLESLGTCGACFETYLDRGEHMPLIMPCGHTYCSSCLSSLPTPKKCPTCRTLLGITPVSSLPHNFALLELLAALPPPTPPLLEKRSLSSMTDEELAQYMEERRLQKAKNKDQADVLSAEKVVLEVERVECALAAGELRAKIESSEQSVAQMLRVYVEAKVELDALQAEEREKMQKEQSIALQLASLEVQIDDLLNNRQPSSQQKAVVVNSSSPSAAVAAVAKAAPAARAGMRISGASGINGGAVNGLYEVTDEVSGGMPVYKKRGAEQWLEYFASSSKWLSRLTSSKGQASAACYAETRCEQGVLPHLAPPGKWQVYEGTVPFTAQASVVVTAMTASEMENELAAVQSTFAAARAKSPHAVRLSGATGSNSGCVNGLYVISNEVFGGMPVYDKQGGGYVLQFFSTSGRWYSRSTAGGAPPSEGNGFAYVACANDVLNPSGSWRVYDAAWVTQASVVASAVSAADVAAAAATTQASCAAARAAATYTLRISGATGPNAALVNGLYEVTEEVFSDMPVYKKQGEDGMFLQYFSSNQRWYARKNTTGTAPPSQGNGWAHLSCPAGRLPDASQGGVWSVYDGSAHTPQPNVVVAREVGTQGA